MHHIAVLKCNRTHFWQLFVVVSKHYTWSNYRRHIINNLAVLNHNLPLREEHNHIYWYSNQIPSIDMYISSRNIYIYIIYIYIYIYIYITSVVISIWKHIFPHFQLRTFLPKQKYHNFSKMSEGRFHMSLEQKYWILGNGEFPTMINCPADHINVIHYPYIAIKKEIIKYVPLTIQ